MTPAPARSSSSGSTAPSPTTVAASSPLFSSPTRPSSPGGRWRRHGTPSADPIGEMAHRRVTDSARTTGRPATVLGRLAAAYAEGDTDLAWARVTLWRGLLAAALDQAPYEPVALRDGHRGARLAVRRPPRRMAHRRAPLPGLARPVPQPDRHHQRAARAQERGHRPGPAAGDGRRRPCRSPGSRTGPSPSPIAVTPSASPTSCDGSTRMRSTRPRSSTASSRSPRRGPRARRRDAGGAVGGRGGARPEAGHEGPAQPQPAPGLTSPEGHIIDRRHG